MSRKRKVREAMAKHPPQPAVLDSMSAAAAELATRRATAWANAPEGTPYSAVVSVKDVRRPEAQK